jgi:hypothetical protein
MIIKNVVLGHLCAYLVELNWTNKSLGHERCVMTGVRDIGQDSNPRPSDQQSSALSLDDNGRLNYGYRNHGHCCDYNHNYVKCIYFYDNKAMGVIVTTVFLIMGIVQLAPR